MSRGLFERLLHKHAAPAEREEEAENAQQEEQAEEATVCQLDCDEPDLALSESSEPAALTGDDEAEVTNEQKKGNAMSALLASDAAPELKKRALRSLFFSGQFSEVDELNDYNQDFSQVKSLSADVASKLRNWTQEKMEQLDELAEDAESDDEVLAQQKEDQNNEDMTEESSAEHGHQRASTDPQSGDKKGA